jgi:hypothetical protein
MPQPLLVSKKATCVNGISSAGWLLFTAGQMASIISIIKQQRLPYTITLVV